MAPFGSSHCALQPPWTSTSQEAWSFPRQSISQDADALAEHEPLQEPEHFALQSALGGVPVHCALHLPLQFALQWALQSACAVPPLADPAH
jgi:hypothetical protein